MKRRAPQYRLYIDESGDHTYKKLDDLGHRYLALLGVWFEQQEAYLNFVHDLEQFKDSLFSERPDNPVILHRTDIINRRGAFGVLCDEDTRGKFDEGLLELITNANFKMVCVLLDKQTHQQQYSDPFHPYHYCLAVMLERYAGWLIYKNAMGDVMAESRGGEEDLQLKQAYRRAYESGTMHFDHEKFHSALSSKDIKIKPKAANIAGLQLADVLAYPVRQAILVGKGSIPDPGNVFGKRMYEAARPKFNCQEWTGQVEGYGFKCL
ncbi:MAG TPA: DUF3800 domain-containing protein [Pyrinomonadaceae bacterium]|nr:DUF3800 domain-containing protein [Pyrinomonadaceae bacterium]